MGLSTDRPSNKHQYAGHSLSITADFVLSETPVYFIMYVHMSFSYGTVGGNDSPYVDG